MKIINNKVWYSNVDHSITDMSQLDYNTHEMVFYLIERGAKFEIGPGNPPKYGNGLYCTNLSIPEIVNYFDERYQQKLEEQALAEAENSSKMPIHEIVKMLIQMGRSYYLAYYHGSMGFVNPGDVLSDIRSDYDDKIIPAIELLSVSERDTLSLELNSILGKAEDPSDVNLQFVKLAFDYISKLDKMKIR